MPLISPFFSLPGGWPRRKARRRRMAVQLMALAVLASIVLPAWFIYKPPAFVFSSFHRRFPDVLFQIRTTRKVVALTIDDAPSQHTSEILDVLKANNAEATFFIIGAQVSGREGLLEDIVRSGSELGNHAMHDEPSISLASPVLAEQLRVIDMLLNKATEDAGKSRTGRYFRPGSGIFSQRILDIATQAGYRTILGSIYPHDPFIKYWRVNAWHILSSVRPGAVIICHDRRSWIVPMLRKVLPQLKRRGYEVVTVSRLLEIAKADAQG